MAKSLQKKPILQRPNQSFARCLHFDTTTGHAIPLFFLQFIRFCMACGWIEQAVKSSRFVAFQTRLPFFDYTKSSQNT